MYVVDPRVGTCRGRGDVEGMNKGHREVSSEFRISSMRSLKVEHTCGGRDCRQVAYLVHTVRSVSLYLEFRLAQAISCWCDDYYHIPGITVPICTSERPIFILPDFVLVCIEYVHLNAAILGTIFDGL